MTMAFTTANFSCSRCRNLTNNLMKSVDAFEVLLTGNAGMPAEILISAIRKIVMNAVQMEETVQKVDNNNEKPDSQPQNKENVASSLDLDVNSTPGFITIGDLSVSNNLDSDLANSGIEQRNLPNSQLLSNSNPPRAKAGKRKRPGRPKGSKNKISQLQANKILAISKAQVNSRKSRRPPRINSSLKSLSLVPQQNSADFGSMPTRSTASCHGKVSRPIATKGDLDQAKEYMKKVTIETPDGLYYYLYECTKCSKQFTWAITAKRHIACVHFNKRQVHTSMKTAVQLVQGTTENTNRLGKVQLLGRQNQGRAGENNSSNSKKRCCLIDLNTAKSKIPSAIEKSGTFRVNRRYKSRNTSSSSASSGLTKRSVPGSISIPPSLTVRNPCANFDLERTLNVRVNVELTPNLSSIRTVSSDQGQSKKTVTTANKNGDDNMTFDCGHTTDEIREADSNKAEEDPAQVHGLSSSYVANQSGENSGEKGITSENSLADGRSQILSDVLSDLIEMDVDTIMKMQL